MDQIDINKHPPSREFLEKHIDAERFLDFVSTRSPVFKERPLPRSKKEAIDLMLKNADDALAAESSNVRREWRNPKTGASGFAEVRAQFVSTAGRLCKRLKVGNRAPNAPAKDATYTLCIHDDRGWLLDTNASP